MIQWKNRPISQLSRDELRTALAEAVGQSLASRATPVSAVSDSFLLGVFSGTAIAAAGFALAVLIV